MIVFKDGTIDNRRVIKKVVYNDIRKWAVVVNEDGSFTDVLIDDSNSTGYLEPIYGGSLISHIELDATFDEKERYRKSKGFFQTGDKVIITRGRKMKGEIKTFKENYEYHIPSTGTVIYYALFTDGTKVQRNYIEFYEED